jgi:hypothetical protein
MAKAGISIGFHAYSRRDPVSGETKTWLRSAHSRQSSPRLKHFQACVRRNMEGKSFRGGDHSANARAVRTTFAAAARNCSGGRGG